MVTIRHASFDDVAAIHAMTQVAYTEYRAVLAGYRRQGLDCALVLAVEDLTKSLNLHQVRLEMRAAQPENDRFYSVAWL